MLIVTGIGICSAARKAGNRVARSSKGIVVTSTTPAVGNGIKHITTYSGYNLLGMLRKQITVETIETPNMLVKIYETLDLKNKQKAKTVLKWIHSMDKFTQKVSVETKNDKKITKKTYVAGELVNDHVGNFFSTGHWVEQKTRTPEDTWKIVYHPFAPY